MSTNNIGQILLNQFRVDAFIDSGGMGAVYRVWDLKRNVPLAMKVLHSDLAEDPAAFKRFKREANALKKLAHPNIVPFYGLYQSHDFAFLLERFIDGSSLAGILRERHGRPLPVSDALVYLKALCAALGYAHANGVVHCDVKPGNVMVEGGGNIYLTDFGIARHAESTATSIGAAGAPAYMAPEQIRGEAVSPATDVYALGVTLFEMLTGQRPFRGTETGTEKGGTTANERIRYGQLHLAPPAPSSLNPDLPVGLSTVILKAMSKQPEARYASTQALFLAVCAAAGKSPAIVADSIAVQGGSVPYVKPIGRAARPSPVVSVASMLSTISKKLGLNSTAALVILCIFIIALAGGAYALIRPKPVPTKPAWVETIPPIPPLNDTPVPSATYTPSKVPTDVPTATATEDPNTPTPFPTMDFSCPGAPPIRVEKGNLVRVVTTERSTLFLRSSPAKYVNNAIDSIKPGEKLRVLDGPFCADNFTFWKVKRPDSSEEGYVIEGDFTLYFIEPIY